MRNAMVLGVAVLLLLVQATRHPQLPETVWRMQEAGPSVRGRTPGAEPPPRSHGSSTQVPTATLPVPGLARVAPSTQGLTTTTCTRSPPRPVR